MSMEKHLPFSGKNYKVISKELELEPIIQFVTPIFKYHICFHPSIITQFETST